MIDALYRARDRRGDGSGALTKLQADIRGQEAKVEKVANTLLDVGVSEALRNRLRQEEDRLRELRGRLAKASTADRALPPPFDVEGLLAAVSDVERAAETDPARAREALAALYEPFLMVPGPDGYTVRIKPRNTTAALAGGPQCLPHVVAGARWTSSLLPKTPCIQAESTPPAPALSPVVGILCMAPGYPTDTGTSYGEGRP